MTLENIVYACYEKHKTHTSNWQRGCDKINLM